MARFRFPLQQVLDYREQLKEQAQVALAQILADLRREEERVRLLQEQLLAQESALNAIPLNSSGDRWLLEHFIRGLRDDITLTLVRVRRLNASMEEARQHLTLRAKEHKILEKLKEKQAERHASNERLQEQRTYDETAAIRFKAPTL